MAQGPARQTHVPQLYLRGFAEGAADDEGALQVFDLKLGTRSTSTPRSDGCGTSIYDLNVEGSDPKDVDPTFQTLEADAAEALNEVVRSRSLPESDERLDHLLTFAGLQAARVAYVRRIQEDAYDQAAPVLMATLVKDMILLGLTIADALSLRRWTLLTTEKHGPEFVATDNPVCLVPRTGSPTSSQQRGFALASNDALYPLSSRAALLGQLDDKLPIRSTKTASREVVARFNAGVLSSASRFVWSRRPRVLYAWQNEIRSDLEYWAARRAEHDKAE